MTPSHLAKVKIFCFDYINGIYTKVYIELDSSVILQKLYKSLARSKMKTRPLACPEPAATVSKVALSKRGAIYMC